MLSYKKALRLSIKKWTMLSKGKSSDSLDVYNKLFDKVCRDSELKTLCNNCGFCEYAEQRIKQTDRIICQNCPINNTDICTFLFKQWSDENNPMYFRITAAKEILEQLKALPERLPQ
jgi:hypothetical protein